MKGLERGGHHHHPHFCTQLKKSLRRPQEQEGRKKGCRIWGAICKQIPPKEVWIFFDFDFFWRKAWVDFCTEPAISAGSNSLGRVCECLSCSPLAIHGVTLYRLLKGVFLLPSSSSLDPTRGMVLPFHDGAGLIFARGASPPKPLWW